MEYNNKQCYCAEPKGDECKLDLWMWLFAASIVPGIGCIVGIILGVNAIVSRL